MAEFVEILISAVRNKKLLWDMRDTRYHNRLLVDRAWTAIAEELGVSKEMVKGKWKNLRDTFKKETEQKKIPKPCSGDDAEQASLYTGTWCNFEAMQFLNPIVTSRKLSGNLFETQNSLLQSPSQEEQSQEEQSQTVGSAETFENEDSDSESQISTRLNKKRQFKQLQKELDVVEKSLPDANGPVCPIKVSASRKRRVVQNEDSFQGEMLQLEGKKLELLGQKDDDDEDINFFKSLLPHVRQLPSINKLNFRTKVQNLLVEELNNIQLQTEYQRSRTVSRCSSDASYQYPPSPYQPDAAQHSSLTVLGQEHGPSEYGSLQGIPEYSHQQPGPSRYGCK